jgi:predicted MFS family arabinose efflux permease
MRADRKPNAGQLVGLLAALVVMSCLSQFYRVSNSVIAPELMRELGLTSEQLGLAGGAFFVTLLIAQVPVGIWFDRYGARITLTCLSVFSVAGAVMVSRATSANELIIARAIIGLGCAANFMALVFLLSRWVEPSRYTAVLATGFALSNIGTLAAATPLAWASATFGWRNTFLFLGLITGLGTAVFWMVVRDRPPGHVVQPLAARSLPDELRGLLTVFRTPGLIPVLAMHTFAYASQLTIIGVWAGPYLFDVHGLDGIDRGNVLLGMGAAQIAGVFSYGPLDRIFRSRKKVVIGGVVLVAIAGGGFPAAAVARRRVADAGRVRRLVWRRHRQSGSRAFSRPFGWSRRDHRQHGAVVRLDGTTGVDGADRRLVSTGGWRCTRDRLSSGIRGAGTR